MNILVIADEESKSLWDFYDETKLEGVDLILSAGDLSPSYLSFLVTMGKAPVLYVHGNHDDKYERHPAGGLHLHRGSDLCVQRHPDSGAGRFHAL